MKMKSVIAGEQTAPSAHGPMMSETWGITPEASTLRWNTSAYPPSEATPSWIRAPPESFRPMTGAPTLRFTPPEALRERPGDKPAPRTGNAAFTRGVE